MNHQSYTFAASVRCKQKPGQMSHCDPMRTIPRSNPASRGEMQDPKFESHSTKKEPNEPFSLSHMRCVPPPPTHANEASSSHPICTETRTDTSIHPHAHTQSTDAPTVISYESHASRIAPPSRSYSSLPLQHPTNLYIHKLSFSCVLLEKGREQLCLSRGFLSRALGAMARM